MTDTRDPQTEKGQNGATEENLAETAQAPEKTLEEQFRDCLLYTSDAADE